MESRIEELTSQLNQTNKDKSKTSRMQRSADKVACDATFQLAKSDRQRAKLEDERKAYEAQIFKLAAGYGFSSAFLSFSYTFYSSVSFSANWGKQSLICQAPNRAEAADYKQKALK